MDSLAPSNSITFKCAMNCSVNANCSLLNGTVKWYANDVLIDVTQLNFLANIRELYGYLPESKWTPYMNQNVCFSV